MGVAVTRLNGGFSEAAVLAAFAREGLAPHRWSNGPGDTYAPHSHGYHKVLYCLRGSITFRVRESDEAIELRPGTGWTSSRGRNMARWWERRASSAWRDT